MPIEKADQPWVLTEQQRRAVIRDRMLVQAPDLTPAQLRRVHAEMERRINGIPLGDLLVLESMIALADQGNVAAQWMIEDLAEHYDLDPRRYRFEGVVDG